MLARRGRKIIKKKKKFSLSRKKICRLCADKVKSLDYKDIKRLESFIRERGKIISPRISGNCAKHQRKLVREIKRARFLSLIPYVGGWSR